MKSKYIKVDNYTELHCVIKGKGEPILFIPGLTFSYEVFIKQIEYFSKNYKVIALDPRSQGLSTKTQHGNNYKTHGNDLHEVIKKLKLNNITLVGWSTGNLDIWSYLKQHGYDKVKKVVTIDMAPKNLLTKKTDWKEGEIDELRYVADEFLTSSKGVRDFFLEYLKTVMFENKPTQKEIDLFLNSSAKTPYYVCRELFLDAIFSDFSSTLEESSQKVETLMFIANHWSKVAKAFMNKNYPKTKTHVLGGHLMFYEYSDEWNKVLEDFIII